MFAVINSCRNESLLQALSEFLKDLDLKEEEKALPSGDKELLV